MDLSRRPIRSRSTVLAVPGSAQRFIDKSRTLDVDAIFLDLEDAVAPDAKVEARGRIVRALKEGQWRASTITIRVNDWTTPWTLDDLCDVIGQAGDKIDTVMLPKTRCEADIQALDRVLTQLERSLSIPVGTIGIEAIIEDGMGLVNVEKIAACSSRLEALIYGPGDFMASMGMRSTSVTGEIGSYPGDAFHHVLSRILVAARAYDLQAIEGPYVKIHDREGLATAARRSAALGFDGKWVLHPDQIDICRQIFSPTDEQVARADEMVKAYREATSRVGGGVGAIMVGDEMVDEAGMKVALRMLARAQHHSTVEMNG